jgi:tetratricopeptide (TPR) repeat protein
MYDQAHPAESIHELVSALEREDQGKYLYRGQVRHYESLLPSVFRKARSGAMLGPCLHALDGERFHSGLGSRGRLRFRVLDWLIRTLGRGVGNLVAQQYGLSSEAIDVTAAPRIAAFFATRTYPTYEHVAASPDCPLGAMYRFPRHDAVRSLQDLDETLARLGHFVSGGGTCWFDECLRRDDNSDALRRAEELLDRRGTEELVLFSQPLIVNYSDFHGYLREAVTKSVIRSLPISVENTRVARQHGGFIRPPIHWRCTVPAVRDIDTAYLLRYRAYIPGVAVKEQLVAVEDTAAFPGLEVFFFRHSGDRIDDFTQKYMWPSSGRDELYELLLEACADDQEIDAYLESEDTWLEDPQKGVIDRGFYTGTEEMAWRARLAQRDGNASDALHFIGDALNLDSDNDEHYLVRASIHADQGDHPAALADVDRALQIEPDNWTAAASRAAILTRMGEVDAAVESLDYAIAHNPNRGELFLARAEALAQANQSDRVVNDCDEALRRFRPGDLATRNVVLRLKALALTSAGRDAEADSVLNLLSKLIDTSRLRAHIAGMRAQRD